MTIAICDKDCCDLLKSFASEGGGPGWFSNWAPDPDGQDPTGKYPPCPCPELHVPMAWGSDPSQLAAGKDFPVGITELSQKRETVNNLNTNTVDTSKLIFSLNEADRGDQGNIDNPWDQVYFHMTAYNNYIEQAKTKLQKTDPSHVDDKTLKEHIRMTSPCFSSPLNSFENNTRYGNGYFHWDFMLACSKTKGCPETINNVCFHHYESDELLCAKENACEFWEFRQPPRTLANGCASKAAANTLILARHTLT